MIGKKKKKLKQNIQYHHIPMSGHVLRLLADHYRTAEAKIREQFQNAIDAGASRIVLDVITTKDKRTWQVCDDGHGGSQKAIDKAFQHIGIPGQKDPDQLGQFSLGFITPVGKCRRHFVTTRSRAQDTYHEWCFDLEDILPQEGTTAIPHYPRPDLDDQWWQTRILCEGVVEGPQSQISLKRLARSVGDKFRDQLLTGDLSIEINIQKGREKQSVTCDASSWHGDPLDVVEYDDDQCGKSVFRLFVAGASSHSAGGVIAFKNAGKPYPVIHSEFLQNHRKLVRGLSQECYKCLNSGVFEGEIVVDDITLHPDRDQFEEDEALAAFFRVLNQWYEDVGSEIYGEIIESRSNEVYQETARNVLKQLSQNKTESLLDKLQKLLADSYDFEVGDGEDFPARAVPPGGDREEVKTRKAKKKTSKKKPANRVENNDRNQGRKYTKDKNFSITISHVEHIPGYDLYLFDPAIATLYICFRHPVWAAAEKLGSQGLEDLQRKILAEVIIIYSSYEEKDRILLMTAFGQAMSIVYS